MNDFLNIPLSDDSEDIPELPLSIICTNCGLPAAVAWCGVANCHHPLNYKMQRLRLRTRCTKCGNSDIYRVAWMVVKNMELIKKEEDNE